MQVVETYINITCMRKKVCHECKTKKPIHNFHQQEKALDGHMTKCKDCKKTYDQQYYRLVREKRLNQSEIWNLINRKGARYFKD